MDKSGINFILYKPAVPGNIGASARAMKTMGFNSLRLINPANFLSDEAKMMAHASRDVLENCKVYDSYEEAISNLDFIICTTAKKRSAKTDYIPSNQLADFLIHKSSLIQNIGIVFGTEESGLPNSILLQANIGLTIPMAGSYPSLNLSQAVMIIAYELSFMETELKSEKSENQTKETWKQLQYRSSSILKEVGIKPSTPLYHRIIERMSFMKASDARLVHSVSSKLYDLIIKKQK